MVLLDIDAALFDWSSQEAPNIRRTARKYGICHTTLQRRWTGVTRSGKRGVRFATTSLSKAQEEVLIKYINILTMRGIPPTIGMLRTFAFEVSGCDVGKNWPRRLIGRWKDHLDSGFLQTIDLARTKAESIRSFELWFSMVSSQLYGRLL